jgi:hypothetical protein
MAIDVHLSEAQQKAIAIAVHSLMWSTGHTEDVAGCGALSYVFQFKRERHLLSPLVFPRSLKLSPAQRRALAAARNKFKSLNGRLMTDRPDLLPSQGLDAYVSDNEPEIRLLEKAFPTAIYCTFGRARRVRPEN